MKRGKRLLLLCLALVVVASAAFAALKLVPDETVEEAETVQVCSFDEDSITKLQWTYEGETLCFDSDGSVWTYDADEDFPLDQAYMSAMTGAVSEVTATKVIEGADDLSEYGLDEPVCSVAVTASGETTTIDIGDETSLDGLRYVSVGDGNVYLVSSDLLTNFSYGLYDLVDMEALPDMSELVSISVERPSGSLLIEKLEDSGLALTDRYEYFARNGEDGYTVLSNELAYSFIYQVTGLTWDSCVDYKAELKTLQDYGLDSPSATVTISYIETTEVETNETDEDGNAVTETRTEEKSLTLEFGSYSGDDCYCRIADSGMVYLVDGSICDSLLYTSVDELLPENIILLDWDGMTGFDIELGGESYEFGMEYSEDDNAYLYTLDGENFALDEVLDSIEALPSNGEAPESAAGLEELLAVTFHADGWEDVELRIYSYDSSSCLAVLNGEIKLLTDRTDAESLCDTITELLAGEAEEE